MNKNIILLYLMLFILTPFSFADYPDLGFYDHSFMAGKGIFNQDLIDFDVNIYPLVNPQIHPLVEDLDGNGIKEIVVYSNSNIVLLQGVDLQPLDSIIVDITPEGQPHFMIYDYDGDGFKEIHVTLPIDEEIKIYEYNGTLLQLEKTHSIAQDHVNGQCVAKCKAVGECVAICPEINSVDTSSPKLVAYNYDDSGVSRDILFDQTINIGTAFCWANTPIITVEDYDRDGIDEFIFSMLVGSTTTGQTVSHLWVVFMFLSINFGL